jgi:hypothetical protein
MIAGSSLNLIPEAIIPFKWLLTMGSSVVIRVVSNGSKWPMKKYENSCDVHLATIHSKVG